MKFRVGDKVRCISSNSDYDVSPEIGKVYKVVAVHNGLCSIEANGITVEMPEDSGYSEMWFLASDFTLVNDFNPLGNCRRFSLSDI